jgi:phosphomannomutase
MFEEIFMSEKNVVKFGTDGWRGIIADDFTFENVRVAARAIAWFVLEHENANAGVCIGYDTRFGSRSFARVVAEVMANAGIPVWFANKITPTPELSFAVRARGAAGGVMITSSHNPADIPAETSARRSRKSGDHGSRFRARVHKST